MLGPHIREGVEQAEAAETFRGKPSVPPRPRVLQVRSGWPGRARPRRVRLFGIALAWQANTLLTLGGLVTDPKQPSAPCLGPNGWTTIADPLAPTDDEDMDFDFDGALQSEGFELWARIGANGMPGAAPLTIEIYRRPAAPRFVFEVMGNATMSDERFFAESFAEFAQLLEQWTRIARNAAVTHLIASLPVQGEPREATVQADLVELAALARAGLS